MRENIIASIVSRYKSVGNRCSYGGVTTTTTVDDCLAAFSKSGRARSSVPAYRLKVKSQSSKFLPRKYGSGFPRARSRHRLAHRSHSVCQPRHCRIHRSVRRQLPRVSCSRIEFFQLSSQQLLVLSSSHGCSSPPSQNNLLCYHARWNCERKMCQCQRPVG